MAATGIPVRAKTSSGRARAGSRQRPRTAAGGYTRDRFCDQFDQVVNNIGGVMKGKDDVVRIALTAILAGGHILFEDYPGTGKTMLARAIAATISADDTRIQCTPDLLPADVTGSPVLNRKTGDFDFRPGPVFGNIFLVDEINRATPKTQSALLQAMAELEVTVDGRTYPLPRPFLLLATQNPVEQAGTFALPEAQLDRFLFKLTLGYADRAAEALVLRSNEQQHSIDRIEAVIDTEEVLAMMAWAREVTISDALVLYIIDLVQATRTDPALALGASSRASMALMAAAKVLAASQGREDVLPDDVKTLIPSVLSHRLALTPDAQLRDEEISNVVDRIIAKTKVPTGVVTGEPSGKLARIAASASA